MMSAASLIKNLPSPPTTRVLPSTEGPKIKNQVWLRNLLISAGLEPVLRHTEKSPISTIYKSASLNLGACNNRNRLIYAALEPILSHTKKYV